MKHYIAEKWRDILVFNNLETREKIWALEAAWFEEPNQRRGGWSGVSRIELNLPEGGTLGVFLKRQEDHVCRSVRHPIKGFSTFQREFKTIQAFQAHQIPSLDVMYFEDWLAEGHQRACLLTVELAGFIPLTSEDFLKEAGLLSSEKKKLSLFAKLAELMHAMHSKKFQHNCFYPNHIFAKNTSEGEFELRVIDLEKVKKTLLKETAVFRDLYTLLRHAHGWSDDDKLAFFKVHQNEEVLSPASSKLWQKLNAKLNAKKAR